MDRAAYKRFVFDASNGDAEVYAKHCDLILLALIGFIAIGHGNWAKVKYTENDPNFLLAANRLQLFSPELSFEELRANVPSSEGPASNLDQNNANIVCEALVKLLKGFPIAIDKLPDIYDLAVHADIPPSQPEEEGPATKPEEQQALDSGSSWKPRGQWWRAASQAAAQQAPASRWLAQSQKCNDEYPCMDPQAEESNFSAMAFEWKSSRCPTDSWKALGIVCQSDAGLGFSHLCIADRQQNQQLWPCETLSRSCCFRCQWVGEGRDPQACGQGESHRAVWKKKGRRFVPRGQVPRLHDTVCRRVPGVKQSAEHMALGTGNSRRKLLSLLALHALHATLCDNVLLSTHNALKFSDMHLCICERHVAFRRWVSMCQ